MGSGQLKKNTVIWKELEVPPKSLKIQKVGSGQSKISTFEKKFSSLLSEISFVISGQWAVHF